MTATSPTPGSATTRAAPPKSSHAARAAAPTGPGAADFASLLAGHMGDEGDEAAAPTAPAAPADAAQAAPAQGGDADAASQLPQPPAALPAAANPLTPGAAGAAVDPAVDEALTPAGAAAGMPAPGGARAARLAADAWAADGAEPREPTHLGGPAPGAGGEPALAADAGWRPVSDAAPAVAPIAPSADGALPSLVAAGDAPAAAPRTAEPQPEPHLPQAHLPQTPGSEAFTQALGQQIRTWLRGGTAHARLSLNPAELGPIDVRIAVTGGQAQVELAATAARTREVLAQALPLLTQQLDGAGLALGGGDVQGGRPQGSGAGQGGASDAALPARLRVGAPGGEALGAQALAALTRPPAAGTALVDLYA